jgi:hypothetical protein
MPAEVKAYGSHVSTPTNGYDAAWQSSTGGRVTFWNLFFVMLIFIPLILLWLFTLNDLTRRSDMSGLSKGLWAVAVVFLPVIGMLLYFIVRPDAPVMAAPAGVVRSDDRDQPLSDADIEELEKMHRLRESGAITGAEFASLKTKMLG